MGDGDLQKACRLGDIDTLESALMSNPQVVNQIEKTGWTLLSRCSACNQPHAVQFLLSHGADPNIQNFIGETALHQAAEYGNIEVAEKLLRCGAETNLQNHDGETPLHIACVKENRDMVQLLLRSKADITLTTRAGYRPIDLCQSEEVRELLSLLDTSKVEQQSPILEPRSEVEDEIPPIPQRSFEHLSLSPHSSRRNSEAFTDKSPRNYANTIRSSTLEPEAEKVDTSTVPVQESVSVSMDEKKLALMQWTRQLHLDEVIRPLIDAGFDDLEQLQAEMKRQPLTPEQLMKIGIRKKGHAVRLLAALDLDQMAASTPRNTSEDKRKLWTCCADPEIAASVSSFPSLQEWLETLGLISLFPAFQDAGYTELDQLLMVMRTKYAFTDATLECDLGIQRPGHRHRILSKLKEDAQLYEPPIKRMLSHVRMERGDAVVSCEFCVLS